MGHARDRFERWWQAIERDDFAAFAEICTEDVEYLLPGMPPVRGLESVVAALSGFRRALPDIRSEVLDTIEAPERIAVSYRVLGSHVDTLVMPDGNAYPPTGQVLVWQANAFVTLDGGRICTYLLHHDQAPVLGALRAAEA